MAVDDGEKGGRGFGFLTRTAIVVLAFVGAWVVAGNLWDWAHPWWRYASVASISFTLGGFYGRFRRFEHDEKKRGAAR